jgi:integrase
MLNDDVTHHIELQRALGFQFNSQAYLLHRFARFAALTGDTHVRTETVLAWAAQAQTAGQRRLRLAVLRRFAWQMQAENGDHEVAPADAFGKSSRERRTPHIYSSEEIRRLLGAAARLQPLGSIRPAAYVTLFALLVATGLRISEALALTVDDMTPSGLVVRNTKFRKSRLVPLQPSVREGLERYLVFRGRVSGTDRSLFVSPSGVGIAKSTVSGVFLALMRAQGMRGAPCSPGPRIHDLRHTFAVRALEGSGGGDREIARHILALATYLGHTRPSDTYWYLHATPKLMEGIAEAGEALFAGGEA